MSYGLFLALFLLPPLAALRIRSGRLTRRLRVTFSILALVAILYTAPWDSAIIRNGVWTYGRHQVIGAVILQVPVEEYIFYVLQVVAAGLLTVVLLQRVGR